MDLALSTTSREENINLQSQLEMQQTGLETERQAQIGLEKVVKLCNSLLSFVTDFGVPDPCGMARTQQPSADDSDDGNQDGRQQTQG